jgi:hypothetical protein
MSFIVPYLPILYYNYFGNIKEAGVIPASGTLFPEKSLPKSEIFGNGF